MIVGLMDKLLFGGAVVLGGALARSLFRGAQEEARRRNSPLCFDDGLTQTEFSDLVHAVAKRTPRVKQAVVNGMKATLHVRSNSGLSTWTAEVDFNDYGHLTGKYWMRTENADSLIPEHFAQELKAQVESRVGRPESEGAQFGG